MRFHLGGIPPTPEFSPDATWKPMREPSPWVMQLLALPIGIAACALIAALWLFLTPLKSIWMDPPEILLVLLVVIIPIHELIHAAVHPHYGRSRDSVLGFWPSRMLFYAHYSGELSRGRFIAILLMPLLIISFFPLLACAILGYKSALLALSSAMNALLACGDIFATGLLLFQIPRAAILRNQEWRTFWKISGSGPSLKPSESNQKQTR